MYYIKVPNVFVGHMRYGKRLCQGQEMKHFIIIITHVTLKYTLI